MFTNYELMTYKYKYLCPWTEPFYNLIRASGSGDGQVEAFERLSIIYTTLSTYDSWYSYWGTVWVTVGKLIRNSEIVMGHWILLPCQGQYMSTTDLWLTSVWSVGWSDTGALAIHDVHWYAMLAFFWSALWVYFPGVEVTFPDRGTFLGWAKRNGWMLWLCAKLEGWANSPNFRTTIMKRVDLHVCFKHAIFQISESMYNIYSILNVTCSIMLAKICKDVPQTDNSDMHLFDRGVYEYQHVSM